MIIELCPAQQQAFDYLMPMLPLGNLFVVRGRDGAGKSMVLQKLRQAWGGTLLEMKDFIDATRGEHPLALEETIERLVMAALSEQDIVIVDDLHVLNQVCHGHAYPRHGWLNAPLVALSTYAIEADKQLIFACNGCAPLPVEQRAFAVQIPKFVVEDYEFLCRRYLKPSAADQLDYDKIYRFTANLNAYQLQMACTWLTCYRWVDTEQFIDYLRTHHLASNVDLHEVQTVAIDDLKGVDDIIQSLEANVVLPLENDELAKELNLRPKRGVLLAGPPGTGKTTIGRALAHRLKSKFFLIDGTFFAGSPEFYGRIHQIFKAAQESAPSVIFIDDTDVLFEQGSELGLYRYLLTMLDGLESESSKRVCVMMTAMDVGNIPVALVRSGRIEVWLETRLPDAAARRAIMQEHLQELPAALTTVDLDKLVAATEEFTGADLKRLVEDGKTLYAYDRARNQPLRAPTEYFLAATATVRTNKERYAQAEARARQPKTPRIRGLTALASGAE